MAVLDLLRSTAHRPEEPLKILCDSQYVINCLTKWMPGWKRKGWRKADGKPVLNVDLLKELDAALKGRNFSFEWVKGHAGHPLNEAADDRARAVATAYQRGGQSIPSGPGFPGAQLTDVAGGSNSQTAGPEERHAAEKPRAAAGPGSQVRSEGQPLGDAEPDLFSVLEEDLRGSFAEQDPVAVVTALEQRLLEPAVRADLGEVARILHPDFEEIGSSGRTWSREETLLALSDEDHTPVDMKPLSASRLNEDTILLQYRTRSAGRTALRSSLWLLSQGVWRLRFHQGTPE